MQGALLRSRLRHWRRNRAPLSQCRWLTEHWSICPPHAPRPEPADAIAAPTTSTGAVDSEALGGVTGRFMPHSRPRRPRWAAMEALYQNRVPGGALQPHGCRSLRPLHGTVDYAKVTARSGALCQEVVWLPDVLLGERRHATSPRPSRRWWRGWEAERLAGRAPPHMQSLQ